MNKPETQSGGSLESIVSEMLGRIMCLEYYLDAAVQNLQHQAGHLTNISDRLTEIRRELSPNDQAEERRICPPPS